MHRRREAFAIHPKSPLMPQSPQSSNLQRTLAAARHGDGEALADLYYRYARVLFQVAYRRLESVDDAQDVVHDVFADLPNVIGQYEGRGSFEGWLVAITVNCSLTLIRRRRRRRETYLPDVACEPAARSPDPIDRIALERALAGLSEKLRRVVILKEYGGYSHQEVARLLGIRQGACTMRLSRARRIMRDLQGGTSPDTPRATVSR